MKSQYINEKLRFIKSLKIMYPVKKQYHFIKYMYRKFVKPKMQITESERDFQSLIKSYKHVKILTTTHCTFIAENIKKTLEKVGVTSEVIYSYQVKNDHLVHIVICPQIFPMLPAYYISVQLEQLASKNNKWYTPEYIQILTRSIAIFDYSKDNINLLHKKEHISFSKLFYLPIEIYDKTLLANNFKQEKEYDILFYGDNNCERRKKYLEKLSEHYNVKIINNLFGNELYNEIKKAKIIINIHYYEDALLETTRLYECLSLGAFIISEDARDLDEYKNIQRLVEFVPTNDIDAMIDKIGYWLGEQDRIYSKVVENIDIQNNLLNSFEFFLLRFFLCNDLIDFNHFYNLTSQYIQLKPRMCLSLAESIDRRKDFQKDNLYDFGIFEGLRHNIGWIGCGMSYKYLLKLACDRKYKVITICEDDVEFYDDFEAEIAVIEKFIQAKLSDTQWSIFSGLIADLNDDTKILDIFEYENKKIVCIDKMTSMVMNIYNLQNGNFLQNWDEKNTNAFINTIDRFIENNSKIKTMVLSPYLVGHKEEANSTLWGGRNDDLYKLMIENSQLKLNRKILAFNNQRVR